MKQGKRILAVLVTWAMIFSQTSFSLAASPAPVSTANQNLPAWVKVGGKIGDDRELGTLDVFVPFMQSENDIWFIDARDKDASGSENEWNVGAGYRRIINDNLILGAYGFFDRMRSDHRNMFSQSSFGVEALTKNLDFRVNGYFPQSKKYDSGVGFTDPSLVVSGTSINYLTTSGEQALPGFDAEFGFRIPKIDPDIRIFAGGFYFHRSDVPNITGPRVRTEWRLNDLFGFKGTRLTIEGEYTHDDVRNSKGFGGASIRIPFGLTSKTSMPGKDTLKARLIEPIVRDVDVVTETPKKLVPAINPVTGEPYSGIWFAEEGGTGVGTQADPTYLADAITKAGVNGIIAALDSNGTINLLTTGAQLLDDQTLIGSGGDLEVLSPKGELDCFHIVGTGTVITADSSTDVITLANDNFISDIEITGGNSGIVGITVPDGEDATGSVHLKNVNIHNTNNYGAHLSNTGDILIENSHFDHNDYRGLAIYRAGDVTITDSTANDNDGRGINIRHAGDVTLTNVTANDSVYSKGIKIYDATGDVTLTDVTADGNDGTNLYIDGVGGNVEIGEGELNSSFSNSDNGSGIEIYNVRGDVTIADSSVNKNYSDNIIIDNVGSYYDEGLAATVYTGGNVLIRNTDAGYYDTGESLDRGSVTGEGIDITNVYKDTEGNDGNVTLTNVTADHNYNANLYIDGVEGDVTIDPSSFSDSHNGHGIDILNIDGGVSISDTDASGNDLTNIWINGIDGTMDYTGAQESVDSDGTYAVQLHSVTANDSVGYRGLGINNVNGGAILIDNNGSAEDRVSEFNGNYWKNISIQDNNHDGEPGDVIIRDTSASGSENSYGISITKADNVTLSDVTANDNSDDNIYITNVGNDAGGNVTITDTVAGYYDAVHSTDHGSVTGEGINITNVYDDGHGNEGNVTLTDVTANHNDENNLYIDNVEGNVTIDPSEFSNSFNGSGMAISNVDGSVGLTDVTAESNHSYGVRLNTTGDVTIDSSYIDSNSNRGLEINHAGDVTITDSTANSNHNTNILIGDVQSIEITDTEANLSTSFYGIGINNVTNGVVLTDVTANGNNHTNLYIRNVGGNITIDPSSFSSSTNGRGIDIANVDGGVSISDTQANANSGTNIGIDNVDGTMAYNGTLPSDESGADFAVQLHSVTANGSENGRGVAIDNVNGGDILIDNNGNADDPVSHFNLNEWTNISINNDNSDNAPGDVTIRDTVASDSWNSDGIRVALADHILITGATTTFALGNDGWDLNFSNYGADNVTHLTQGVNYDTLNH
jgi:trimeric autotransporter adhesin